MRRLLLPLLPLVLVACSSGTPTTAPSESNQPKGDLAVLAERIDQRRAELKTTRFHTVGFASDGDATEVRNTVDGSVRQESSGLTGTMTMDVTTGAQPAKKIDLVLVADGVYVHVDGAPMPEGKKWGYYSRDRSGDLSALLRGFGPGATVGAELDYVQPRAALILDRVDEPVGGTPATRYDLVVDPQKMAKVIQDPDIQLQHTQLAEYGVKIAASVWVDNTGAPLKAEYTFTLNDKVVKQSSSTFEDWGKPIDVPVPAEAETIPAEQLPQ
ncbi:hypothetical protein [Actinosynnema sp. NPDC020468]|uniref:hypothetical protein n=1 Tax=Actinosynnema sp. NPDC020468 TaxID=3154488 RepID=UPI00340EEA0C